MKFSSIDFIKSVSKFSNLNFKMYCNICYEVSIFSSQSDSKKCDSDSKKININYFD